MPASTTRTALAVLGAVLLSLPVLACSDDGGLDPNDPDNPSALGLAVGVRLDPATFQSTGEFSLELIPSNAQGQSLVNEQWTITTSIETPSGPSASLLSQMVEVGDGRPFAMAVDIDNSPSMVANDPDNERKDAAQFLGTSLLAENASTRLSIFEFGAGPTSTPPETAGFPGTRLVQDWTSSSATYTAGLNGLATYPQGGSRVYRSLTEITKWIDSTTNVATEKRGIVVVTDGIPDDTAIRNELFAETAPSETRIYTVGLGPGSDRGGETDPAAVQELQLIANTTGGLYVGAATPERLTSLLQALASSSTDGVIVARFQLSSIPAPGTTVSGRVRMEGAFGIAQAPWTFLAP